MDLISNTVVPTWVMVIVVGVLTLSLLGGVPLARAAGRRRGHRLAHPELFTKLGEKAKDTALFLAALVPSILVWLAVMGVSFVGLTGFAADVMKWHHWTNMLVPLSLDGISVSFGAWAFVAVKRGRHPGRAYKIVAAAATMSAVLNFVHGHEKYSVWAGGYLAFLSFAGMAMFHELLDQFMAALDDEVALKTRYPRFGQRWLYAPISTFAARRTWIVHPPGDLKPTVENALEWHQQVRATKAVRPQRQAMLQEKAALQMKLELVTMRAELDETQRAINAANRPEPTQRRKPLPQPPTNDRTERPDEEDKQSERTERPADADRRQRVPDAPDDPGVRKWAAHILAVAGAHPDWPDQLPTYNNIKETVAAARGTKGSMSTTKAIRDAMQLLQRTPDPRQTLESLRVLVSAEETLTQAEVELSQEQQTTHET